MTGTCKLNLRTGLACSCWIVEKALPMQPEGAPALVVMVSGMENATMLLAQKRPLRQRRHPLRLETQVLKKCSVQLAREFPAHGVGDSRHARALTPRSLCWLES